jgi:hypothetical protein
MPRAIGQVEADGRFTGGHGSESMFFAEVPVPVEILPVPGAGERPLCVRDQGASVLEEGSDVVRDGGEREFGWVHGQGSLRQGNC